MLAVIAAINSVIALFYYATIARKMWADDPSESDLNTVEITPSLVSALAICVLVTLLFGIFPQLVARFTEVSLLAFGV